MRRMQRTVYALAGVVLGLAMSSSASAQSVSPGSITEVQPLLPPGISEFDIELYGKLASTWAMSDGTNVVEIQGNFKGRVGQYELSSRDAVIWFHNRVWKDYEYIETYEGRLIDAKGVKGRYVRLYSNGNTSSDMNHYIEVEVYATPAK